tara:strand:- start:337 stop:522 length:186 start_codon:yes stop_codon:yes gene_type:complete
VTKQQKRDQYYTSIVEVEVALMANPLITFDWEHIMVAGHSIGGNIDCNTILQARKNLWILL